MNNQHKSGRIRTGLELTKSAWIVLKLDKELINLPLISIVASTFAVLGFIGIFLAGSIYLHGGIVHDNSQFNLGYATVPFLLVAAFGLTLITNFFTGAVLFGATQRFRGENPTVRSSLAGARSKLRPLAMFSLLMATVGLALQLIGERVPFAGKIAVWLLSASWNVANFFALPIIMLSDHEVRPFDATKQSAQMVRKVWGESVVASAGIGIVSFLAVLLYIGATSAIGFGFSTIHAPFALILPIGILGVFGLVTLCLVFSALGGIVKAAIYHYATTGTSPVAFNQEQLRSSMSVKKARKIFG